MSKRDPFDLPAFKMLRKMDTLRNIGTPYELPMFKIIRDMEPMKTLREIGKQWDKVRDIWKPLELPSPLKSLMETRDHLHKILAKPEIAKLLPTIKSDDLPEPINPILMLADRVDRLEDAVLALTSALMDRGIIKPPKIKA
jgi:hypothetical protein